MSVPPLSVQLRPYATAAPALARKDPLTLDATIGMPTNGMCPINWIHQRVPIVGERRTSIGMTANDITIQMKGPYSDPTLSSPYGEARRPRTQGERRTRNRKTADHPKGTPK